MSNIFRRYFARLAGKEKRSPSRRRLTPFFEALEDRLVPTITGTHLGAQTWNGDTTFAYGENVFITTYFGDPLTSQTPTGTVLWSLDNAYIASSSLSTVAPELASANYSFGPLSLGFHTIEAHYLGDSYFADSEALSGVGPYSFPLDIEVVIADTLPLITPSDNNIRPNTPLSLDSIISVVAPGGGTPTGTATFVIDSVAQTPISLSGGAATLSLPSGLAAGSYDIYLEYSGDTNFDDSVSQHITLVVANPKQLSGSAGTAADGVCLNQTGTLNKTPAPATGNNTPGKSAHPIRYADGVAQIAATDLYSSALGLDWAFTRSWTNGPGYASGGILGSGWVVTQMPTLVQIDGNDIIAEISNGMTAQYFDLDVDTYLPRNFDQTVFIHDDGNDEFLMIDGFGNRIAFYDFTVSPALKKGAFKSFTAPDGSVIEVTDHDTAGRIAQMQIVSGSNIESWDFTYITGLNPNAGLLANIVLQTSADAGSSWTTTREADYTYYDGSQKHGNRGDLWTVAVTGPNSEIIENSYYRYYTAAEVANGADGYAHGLEYVFAMQSFGRLTEALGTTSAAALDAFSNNEVKAYASNYFAYDPETLQITAEIAQAAGCSACAGGLGVFTYAYESSANALDTNAWATKTTETLPDGNQTLLYANGYGQTMLEVFIDNSTVSPTQWITYHQYDADGRRILTANPSAVNGYDEFAADLMDFTLGVSAYLNDDSGLITFYTYYTSLSSPAATDSTPGAAPGYLQEIAIQHGESGTPLPQETWTYFAITAGDATLYPIAADTVYRNDNGTGGLTTTYAYSFIADTTRIASTTITYPTVTTLQNGPNTASQETVVFDAHARPLWTRDADGYLTYTEYDPLSGGVLKTIVDVDTAGSGFADLPTLWETPIGGGLHIVTEYEVDALGRATKMIDPVGNITYFRYDDAAREVRTYAGWHYDAIATAYVTTGPIVITREAWGETDDADFYGYTETLTLSALPGETGDVPDGSETIASADIESLTRSYVNKAGQVVAVDVYTDLTGVTYSTAVGLGDAGVHYLRTIYSYDAAGRLNRTVDPAGVITRTVYDGLGRPVSEWIGADDVPVADPWSPTNAADMVMIRDYTYDDGGVGDGNLTTLNEYPGHAQPTIQTDSFYDWRNRIVAIKAGVEADESAGATVNRPISYFEYDNLNQIVASEIYDGDDEDITATDGVPDKPTADLLRARTETAFDNEGKIYQVIQVGVDQTDGSLTANTLVTNTFYDRRGNVVGASDGLDLLTQYTYDGASRLIATIDPLLHESTVEYDNASNIVVTRDGLENPTTMTYDAANRLIATEVRIDLTHTAVTEIEYDKAGWVAISRDANENETAFTYDLAGRLLTTTNALSETTTNHYNALGQLSGVEDDLEALTAFTYDDRGRQIAITNAIGSTWVTFFDDLDRVIASADPLGNWTSTLRSVAGRVIGQFDELGHMFLTEYNALGQVVATATPTDANSAHDIMTFNTYDEFNRLWTASDASGTTTFAYDAASRRTSLTDPVGNITTFVFDDASRMIEEIDPKNVSATFAYDDANRLTSTTDRELRRRDFAYDDMGRKLTETWVAGDGMTVVDTLTFTYDAVGNQLTAANAAGTHTMVYDALNRVTHSAQPSGMSLTFTYDRVGNRTRVEDSEGGVETSTYDPAHQLLRRRQADDSWVDFHYDPVGREIATTRHLGDPDLTAIENGDIAVRGIVVNGGPNISVSGGSLHLGGQSSVVKQILVVFNQPVTLASDAISITPKTGVTVNGGVIAPSTDSVTASLAAVSGSNGMQYLVTFSGDGTHGSGLLDGGVWDLTIDNAKVSDGTTTMADDVTGAFFSMFGTIDANNSYAIPGGATSNAFVDPGSLFQFSDAFGSYFNNPYYPTPIYNPTFDVNLDGYVDVWDLFNFSDWFGTDWSWTAASASAPTLVAFTAKTYDAAGRVTEHVSAERNGVELDYHGYEYDFANRVTRDQHNGDIKTYAYDNASQLTSETNGSGTTTYAYDANGNREEVDSSNNDDDRDYTTGDDNQYETDGVWDYTYSPNGNLIGRVSTTTDETWEYTYDHRDQLVRVDRMMNGTDVDQRIDFTYDAWGNRVGKTVDLDGSSGSPYVPPTETTQYPSYVIGKSSEYTATDWSAMQATGASDVASYGDNANAWAALDPDSAEYLSLGLTTPMYVQDVTIRESYNVGFVTKVELIKMDNSRVQIWAGTDPSTGTSIVNFTVYVRDGNGDTIETDYLVKGIKIYIDGTHVLEDWEEIDSVAVHGTLPEIEADNLEPVTTQFTIDGWNPAKGPAIGLENFDVWSDHTDSSLTTRYLWGDGVKQLLGRTEIVGETSTQLWYLTDKLGSINTVISATGEVLDKIDYDAFGNILSETNPANRGRFTWTAQEREDLIDGQFNGRRVYFFFIGAWSSKDPGSFAMGDPNLYRYVHNSPTNAGDPSGLQMPVGPGVLPQPPRDPRFELLDLSGQVQPTSRSGFSAEELRIGQRILQDQRDNMRNVIAQQRLMESLDLERNFNQEIDDGVDVLNQYLTLGLIDYYNRRAATVRRSRQNASANCQLAYGQQESWFLLGTVSAYAALAGQLWQMGGFARTVGATPTVASSATSFEAFIVGRTFPGGAAEAQRAWAVYQRAGQAQQGLVIGHGDAPIMAATNGWQAFRAGEIPGQWTPAINRAWLEGGVDAGLPVRLVTPFQNIVRGSVTWDEIQWVISRGGRLVVE